MSEQEMQAYVFGSLFTLSNRLQVVGDSLDEAMTVKQWFLMAVLFRSEERELSLSTLAQRMGSSRQNVKKMALLLEKQGFLSIERSEDDRRFLMVRPTQACLEHFKGRQAMEEAFIKALFAGFSLEELHHLCQGFAKLAANIEALEEGPHA